jgi:hypothetical protein
MSTLATRPAGLVDCIAGACGRKVPRSAGRAPQDDMDGEGKLGTGGRFGGLVRSSLMWLEWGSSTTGRSSRGSLALACGPFGLDFNSSRAAGCVMEKAAPRPVFGALAQSLVHRVPMNWALVDCIVGACGRKVLRSAERAPQDDKDVSAMTLCATGDPSLRLKNGYAQDGKVVLRPNWRVVRPFPTQ